ncbi:MAG: carboxypeptidase-like regulatory domain-containing protein [Terracidiphilus sp.]
MLEDQGKRISPNPLVMIAFAALAPLCLTAQQTSVVAINNGLPDAPGMESSSGESSQHLLEQKGSATIFGTVLDTNGSEIQDAPVVLSTLSGASKRTVQSGSNGEFTFTGLPPGVFRLTVTGPGWGTFVSPNIHLHANDFYILKQVVLPVAATATVRVDANREEIAQEQVRIAEQQRVLGVFPNFYSSYDWNAPPMGPRQKFQLALRSATDPVTFLGVGIVAGIEQADNRFPGYGQGMQGYSKRFGADYADAFTGRMLGSAVFPSLLHQDPRYFYKGNGSIHSRVFYAITSAVIARGDDGRREPNYSYVLGSFTAGGLSNLYRPSADRGVSLTVMNGLIGIADHAGTNLLREFVFKRFTSRASKDADGPS